MEISFTLKSRPFSINSMYYRSGSRTKEARNWGDNILDQVQKLNLSSKFKLFREKYNKKIHGISVTYLFGIKKSRFFNKDGDISIRSMDLTNVEKPLTDLLFAEKYRDRDGIENVAIDDRFICEVRSKKFAADIDSIKVSISIFNL